MLTVRKYFLVISIILTMIVFMPFAYTNLPSLLGSYHAWVLIWSISLVLLKPRVLFQKMMLLVFLFGVYLYFMLNIFWTEMDIWHIRSIWDDYYSLIVATSIITYFTYTKDYKNLAILTKYAVLFIGITALMTIIVSIINPMYSRHIVSFGQNETFTSSYKDTIHSLQKWGAGSRADGFGFMALMPILLYYYKSRIKIFLSKPWIVLFIGLCLLALLRMQFTALLIFGIMTLFLAFINPKNRTYMLIGFLFLLLLYIVIPSEVFASFFFKFSEATQEYEALSFRLNDIGMYITLGGGELEANAVSGRLDIRYASAWQYFKQNPLFGVYFNQSSNYGLFDEQHLFLMNKLTVTGLVSFGFWTFVFVVFYKKITQKLSKEYKFYFAVVFFTLIFYGLVKVIIVRQVWMFIFVILPGMYYLPLLNKPTKNLIN